MFSSRDKIRAWRFKWKMGADNFINTTSYCEHLIQSLLMSRARTVGSKMIQPRMKYSFPGWRGEAWVVPESDHSPIPLGVELVGRGILSAPAPRQIDLGSARSALAIRHVLCSNCHLRSRMTINLSCQCRFDRHKIHRQASIAESGLAPSTWRLLLRWPPRWGAPGRR